MLSNNLAEEISFVIVMPCEIDEDSQREIFDRFDVEIWDIGNLIYLCEENRALMQLLTSCIPYSTLEVEAKRPMENCGFKPPEIKQVVAELYTVFDFKTIEEAASHYYESSF